MKQALTTLLHQEPLHMKQALTTLLHQDPLHMKQAVTSPPASGTLAYETSPHHTIASGSLAYDTSWLLFAVANKSMWGQSTCPYSGLLPFNFSRDEGLDRAPCPASPNAQGQLWLRELGGKLLAPGAGRWTISPVSHRYKLRLIFFHYYGLIINTNLSRNNIYKYISDQKI